MIRQEAVDWVRDRAWRFWPSLTILIRVPPWHWRRPMTEHDRAGGYVQAGPVEIRWER